MADRGGAPVWRPPDTFGSAAARTWHRHTRRIARLHATATLLLMALAAFAQEASTVIGPTNIDLQDGANALLAGDVEEGIRLTLQGLRQANNVRDRHTGWSNLCAGYVLQNRLETALEYCDKVIAETDGHWRAYSNRALIYVQLKRYAEAEQDLQAAEAISPGARNIKAVRAMLRDAVDPVAPSVIIDDRRKPGEDALDN